MSTVIKVENLSKKYIIAHQKRERYLTLRDTIARKSKEIGKRLLHPFVSSSGQPLAGLAGTEEFWALKDISFDVQQGNRIGIIGRNGAGKSTLLKILSRITEPTTGRIKIKSRVASLLEVGTGFHPELTGRENIFLNGAILGMGKAEIKKKFDEIVAFAEVEKFLDTPVKRFSSGMYVRLAFAVAAHLEPEILIVDEVLAVGDTQFQRKCLGKMEDIGREGRTVLFVSHNMSAIQKLCNRAMLLDNGRLMADDEPVTVINSYLHNHQPTSECWALDSKKFTHSGPVLITDIKLLDLDNNILKILFTGGGFVLQIAYKLKEGVKIPSASFIIKFKNQMNTEILRLSNTPISGFPIENLSGEGRINLVLPVIPFAEGMYYIDIALARQGQGFYVKLINVLSLYINGQDIYKSGCAVTQTRGLTVLPHKWIFKPENNASVESGWKGAELLSKPAEICRENS